ncbi:MAG: AAC(3) family N-acetyltransferase, partial [Planctomycetes bacterium]|nr:AAC(3) family N-acetyltransferase [Planctomycetota bacterium]
MWKQNVPPLDREGKEVNFGKVPPTNPQSKIDSRFQMGSLKLFAGRVVREWLPAPVARTVHQARANWKSWRSNVNERRLIKQYGRFTPEMLRARLVAEGVREGGVLFVHSRMDAFTNFDGTALDVLDVLFNLMGTTGTLAMPSQPDPKAAKFDIGRTPTWTGLLCELFRRTEG